MMMLLFLWLSRSTDPLTHLWIGPHDLLRAVAVVGVDVNDGHAVDRVAPLHPQGVEGPDGRGVEEGGGRWWDGWVGVWVCKCVWFVLVDFLVCVCEQCE